ncbi:transposase [Streptomyces cellostaticus]|uniref:transposase n=1 Tax=Streptomyces cellostaticus TaxID=67285 RepID=UPI0027E298A5|nr:transposase [Streptomyces cellostaticus]
MRSLDSGTVVCAQWSSNEPVIAAWKERHRSVSGHQGAYAMREIVDSILYQGRTGCPWAYLPHMEVRPSWGRVEAGAGRPGVRRSGSAVSPTAGSGPGSTSVGRPPCPVPARSVPGR